MPRDRWGAWHRTRHRRGARGRRRVCVLAGSPTSSRRRLRALGAAGRARPSTPGLPATGRSRDASPTASPSSGSIDILVNNAGTNPTFGPMIDTEPRAVRKVLEVNLEGPLLLMQAAWRSWMRDQGGVVINVASLGGIRPSLGIGMYNTSKAALVHMTRQLAVELRSRRAGERARPGLVKTHFARPVRARRGGDGRPVPDEAARGTRRSLAGAALFLIRRVVVDDGRRARRRRRRLVGGP